jgi:hypothetical protein
VDYLRFVEQTWDRIKIARHILSTRPLQVTGAYPALGAELQYLINQRRTADDRGTGAMALCIEVNSLA